MRFNPEASAADITKFFDAYKASLVEGPRAGGVYRIRVARERCREGRARQDRRPHGARTRASSPSSSRLLEPALDGTPRLRPSFETRA